MSRPCTPTELLDRIRRTLDRDPTLREVDLQGEITNFSRAASGHLYFALKDRRCRVRCVMFASDARRLKFAPEDGMAVVAHGAVSLYEARGDLQLHVRHLEPDGEGALYAALERLKRRLAAEGLFDSARKRPLPFLPARVGVVTSREGAVLHDILTTLRRRNPAVQVLVVPAPVQGVEAAPALAGALRRCETAGVDCIILARGGGSPEDLMAFNEEGLVRAVAACRVPVVSAVGHEPDTTLCDLAADLRAPTPTAAAEMIAPDRGELLRQLRGLRQRMAAALRGRVRSRREVLERLRASPSLRYPCRRVDQERQRVDELREAARRSLVRRCAAERSRLEMLRRSRSLRCPRRLLAGRAEEVRWLRRSLGEALRRYLERHGAALSGLRGRLEALAPSRVLERGYAAVFDEAGRVVTRARGRHPGEGLQVRMCDGNLGCRVEAVALESPEEVLT